MKKTLALIAALTAMVILLTACGGGGSSLEGTWKLTDVKGEGIGDEFTQSFQMVQSFGGSVTISFNNGTMTIKASIWGEEQSQQGAYKINGNKLEVEGSSVDFSVNGNTLTFSSDGVTLVLTRQ